MSTLPTPWRFCLHALVVTWAALLLAGSPAISLAESPQSLLPAFGSAGTEFSTKAKDGHTVKGWLPQDWSDNSEWAPVSATYSKLADGPAPGVASVRIAVEKVDEGGLVQLTTYQGLQTFKGGTTYVVSGWLRSSSGLSVKVGARQKTDPWEFFHEQDLSAGSEWKRFEFSFQPQSDREANVMFVISEPGTVDLAGVVLTAKP